MADPNDPVPTKEFSEQLERLYAEARDEMAALGSETGGSPLGELSRELSTLQTHSKQTSEALGRIEKTLALQQRSLEDIEAVKSLIEKAQEIESAHQRLFDALHEELKGYKDAFLFDALQKPFIKDLIALHDDLQAASRQASEARDGVVSGALDAEAASAALDTASANIENLLFLLVEIFNRLDVTREPPSTGPVDKRLQKVVSTAPAERPEDDGQIIESLRPGFTWRGRTLRPEEVRILRST